MEKQMSELKKFSGYISNKKELAVALGFERTDEEYVKGAYDKWGMDMISHLHGMFASEADQFIVEGS